MSVMLVLAPIQDPATATTIYGAGHQLNYGNEDLVRQWQRDGKISLYGAEPRQVRVSPIAATTATVNWTVDYTAGSMRVEFGTTTAFGSTQTATPTLGVGSIVANLTGLTTATLYYYRIVTYYTTLWTYSLTYTFTTL